MNIRILMFVVLCDYVYVSTCMCVIQKFVQQLPLIEPLSYETLAKMTTHFTMTMTEYRLYSLIYYQMRKPITGGLRTTSSTVLQTSTSFNVVFSSVF